MCVASASSANTRVTALQPHGTHRGSVEKAALALDVVIAKVCRCIKFVGGGLEDWEHRRTLHTGMREASDGLCHATVPQHPSVGDRIVSTASC